MVNNVRERRRLKRTDATSTINRARLSLDDMTKEQIKTTLTRLDNLRLDLKDLDVAIFDQIMREGATEDDSNSEYESCVQYEENIISTIMWLREKLEEFDARSDRNVDRSNHEHERPRSFCFGSRS